MAGVVTSDRRRVGVDALRSDQVGSLIRPAALIEARRRLAGGETSREALAEAEDTAIVAALERQASIGIGIVSDGEMRRQAWQTDLSDAVAGFADDYPVEEYTEADGTKRRLQMHTKIVEGRLRQQRPIVADAARFLAERTEQPFKVTMPSPVRSAQAGFRPGVTDAVYEDRHALLADLIAIYAGEMRELASTGASYIQLDEGFINYIYEDWRDQQTDAGIDVEADLLRDIEAENAVWAGLGDREVVRGAHLCRGSRTRSGKAASYDWLAERLFDRLDVDRFLLEYDTERAGGFEPLRFLPAGKVAVLGLVSSKFGELESEDDLLRRIEEASRFAAVEQLALSPQCGFAGVADNAYMTEEQQWAKFELVVGVARKVWG